MKRIETLKSIVGNDYENWIYFEIFNNNKDLKTIKKELNKDYKEIYFEIETQEEANKLLRLINEIRKATTFYELIDTLHVSNSDRI